MASSRLQWNIHWPTTLLALGLLPLLLGLGNWQLQRAEEKRLAQSALESSADALPLAIAQWPQQPAMYTRIEVRGRFDNARSFLLDNRILHGRFGYEVLTPFQPADDARALLVDRGWIEGDPSRQQRPRIAAVEGEVLLTGSVYRDTARWHLFDNIHENQWPKLIQNLQIDDLQQQLGTAIFPFVMRLDAGTPGALRAEWQIYSAGFGPERHVAYAVTWFTMALTLAIIWLLLSSNLWQLIRAQSK